VDSATDTESKSGLMGLVTKETGRTTEHMVSVNSPTLTGMYMRETGSTIRPMDKACTFM
jgi:hypothetical protein